MMALSREFDLRYLDAVEICPAQKEPSALQLKLDGMSRRVRDGYESTKSFVQTLGQEVSTGAARLQDELAQQIDTAAEKIVQTSTRGAVVAASIYVVTELLTQPTHTKESLLIFATALSLRLAAREQLREPDTSSLRAWRLRDRN